MSRRSWFDAARALARAPLAVLLGSILAAEAMVSTSHAAPPRSPTDPAAIEGAVLDAAGRPVEGALVAAVPETQGSGEPETRAAAYAVSAKDGRFRLAPLPAGPYAVTATRRGLAAAYVGGKSLVPGRALRAVELRFGTDGHTLRGVVRNHRGSPIPRAEIRAIRFSDFLGDVFYAVADDAGAYEITLPAATYHLFAAVDGFALEMVRTDATIDRTVDLTLYPPVVAGPPPDAVADWIWANAVPIRTVEAGHGFDDLEPLRAVVGDARVVALGEATHGTREFFQLKHRLLEFLVGEMGFDVFAIEANMPEAFDVNDYVMTGRGDPERALAGLYLWVWDTREVLDLIRWMRRWNSDPAHRKKVKFYGFDMQDRARAAKNALKTLRTIDPREADRAAGILEPFGNPYLTERGLRAPSSPAARVEAVDSTFQALAERFEARRPRDLARAGERGLAIARQNIRLLQQWILMSQEGPVVRDRAMAENIRWILGHEGPDAKMVVWAHNGHVSRASPDAGGGGMGSYLQGSLGEGMVVFGFAFDRGGFRAMDVAGGRVVKAFTVGPARPGSLDDALSGAGRPIAALDLRRLPAAGEVSDWFLTRRPVRIIGSTYSDSLGERFYRHIVPPRDFDAILFVDSTTAARPNPRGERPRVPVASRAANLDFEEGAVGSPPPGWTGPARLAADHYRAETRTIESRPGPRCGSIRRLRGDPYGETYGTLSQIVDATPYGGKRVRLSASVRVEPADAGDRAFLYLRVSAGPSGGGKPLFHDGMEDRPITSKEWRTYTIEGDVPAGAEAVTFGLAFVGDGSAWIDSVSLEPLGTSEP